MLKNKIICGDALIELKKLKANSIDLTVTSPPYDNLRTYSGIEWNENIWKEIIKDLYRITKDGGVVIWVVGDATIKGSETGTSFRQSLYFKDIGFNLHDTMIYHKKSYVPLTHNRYEQCFEYMFVFSKGKLKTFNGIKIPVLGISGGSFGFIERDGSTRKAHSKRGINTTKLHSNLFTYATGQQRNGHPAVFPKQLAKDHILSWSNKGDTILDPFMGSGTVGVVCKELNRKFIGIELSPEYCKLAKERIHGKATTTK